jgi:dTDP-4-amino-4,6-dideoxygalactose transaminase
MPGTNFRMPNFCAALGNSQFSRIGSFIEARKAIDDLYRHNITSSSIGNFVNFQEHKNNEIVPWSFPIAFKKISPTRLSNIIRLLHEKGIETRPGFRTPNFLPYLKYMVDPRLFPISQKLSTSIISLPAYPYLVEADVELICNSLIEAFETER